MKILYGKRQNELNSSELIRLISGRSPIHVDIGTGSGRLVFKHALRNSEGFYIGVDPSASGMYENSVKAAKLMKKHELDNLLYVIAPIEAIPAALNGIADAVTVILPWGSLRDGIVNADSLVLNNLRNLGKSGTKFEIVVGYDSIIESGEIAKRALPDLSLMFYHSLVPAYRTAGIEINCITEIGNHELKLIDSDWAKRLGYGQMRTIYKLNCLYI